MEKVLIKSTSVCEVYSLGDKRIKKVLQSRYWFFDFSMETYGKFNIHSDVFPRTYYVGKNTVTMKKLNTEYISYMDKILNDECGKTYFGSSVNYIYHLYENRQYASLKRYRSRLNSEESIVFFDKIMYLLRRLRHLYGKLGFFRFNEIDFHSGNIGLDSDGRIKIFDF